MIRFFCILILLPSIVANAQIIDFNNFNEKTMNEVLFNCMSDFTMSEWNYPLIQSSVGQQKIYRCIKKNSEKLSLDKLNSKINIQILRKYDSKSISQTNLVGNVGLLNSILSKDVTTYQDIANKCISDWQNSIEGLLFMKWSQISEVVTYYNKKNKTVYVCLAFLN